MTPQALDSLRDVHLPPEPLFWQTPVCWIALVLLIALISWALHRVIRRRKLRAALRRVSALMTAYRRDGDTVRLARDLSGLLRSYASARFPQAGVEGLVGRALLDFLDTHGGKGAFRSGAGAVLETLPYQPSGIADAAGLVSAVRAWLLENPQ